jgi:hypothetical protein
VRPSGACSPFHRESESLERLYPYSSRGYLSARAIPEYQKTFSMQIVFLQKSPAHRFPARITASAQVFTGTAMVSEAFEQQADGIGLPDDIPRSPSGYFETRPKATSR